MAKNTKKTREIPKSRSYGWTVHLLSKYYGHGNRKRFKSYAELKETASRIHKTIVKEQKGKINLKSVRLQINEIKPLPPSKASIKRIQNTKPPFPSALQGLLPYWYFSDDPPTTDSNTGVGILQAIEGADPLWRFKSKRLLGEGVELKGGEKYDYYEYFQDFVNHCNRLSTDNDSSNISYLIKFEESEAFKNKDGSWTMTFIVTNDFGREEVDTGYDPKNKEAVPFSKEDLIADALKPKQPEVKKEEPAKTIQIGETEMDRLIKAQKAALESAKMLKELGEDELSKEAIKKYVELDKRINELTK